MSALFSALTSGLTRFVYAWLAPSAIAIALFAALVLPYAPDGPSVTPFIRDSPLEAAGTFALAAVGSAIALAYGSFPLYRFLEGYTMPRWLSTRLQRRHIRNWYRLHATFERTVGKTPTWGLTLEEMAQYPAEPHLVLPTALGNALRSMENYGRTSYGLDSQSLWYELISVAGNDVRDEVDDARASVDFFIASLFYLLAVGLASLSVAAWAVTFPPVLPGAACLALVPFAYRQAVRNVAEWRGATRALVNLGRVPLASALGFALPSTFAEEREMWENFTRLVHYGPKPKYLNVLDKSRLQITP